MKIFDFHYNVARKRISVALKKRRKGMDEMVITYADKAIHRLQKKFAKASYRALNVPLKTSKATDGRSKALPIAPERAITKGAPAEK